MTIPKSFKTFLKYTLILGAMSYLLWKVFNNLDLYPESEESGAFGEKLNFLYGEWKRSNVFWMLLSVSIMMISHWQRGIRWKMLLTPLGYNVKNSSAFLAVINGYFINLMIPRGGEISRPVMLKRLENVPTGTSIGTVVAERVIDLFFLLILISVVVIFQLHKFYDFFANHYEETAGHASNGGISTWYFITAGVLLIAFVTTIIFILNKSLFEKLKIKLKESLKGIKEGLLVVKRLENNWLFIGHSLSIWIWYYAMLYTGMLAYEPTASLGAFDALTIFVIGGIAMAVPLPGGTGTFHSLVPLALVYLCGILIMKEAIAFAIVYHLYQTIFLIIVGAICLIISQRLTRQAPLDNID